MYDEQGCQPAHCRAAVNARDGGRHRGGKYHGVCIAGIPTFWLHLSDRSVHDQDTMGRDSKRVQVHVLIARPPRCTFSRTTKCSREPELEAGQSCSFCWHATSCLN